MIEGSFLCPDCFLVLIPLLPIGFVTPKLFVKFQLYFLAAFLFFLALFNFGIYSNNSEKLFWWHDLWNYFFSDFYLGAIMITLHAWIINFPPRVNIYSTGGNYFQSRVEISGLFHILTVWNVGRIFAAIGVHVKYYFYPVHGVSFFRGISPGLAFLDMYLLTSKREGTWYKNFLPFLVVGLFFVGAGVSIARAIFFYPEIFIINKNVST
jgi:hypothetical protein